MTPEDWLNGRDTGTSSRTIYAVLQNCRMDCYDVPHDPDDFGRCYRLLKLFPAWKDRLPEVTLRFPAWAALVREWDKLTAMYEAAINSKADRAPEMYALMRELRKESQAA